MPGRTLTPALAARMTSARVLRLVRACEEAVEWAAPYVVSGDAWNSCARPDWLLWLLEKFGIRDACNDRLFACWCVRHTPLPDGRSVWDLLTLPGSRRAVEVAEGFARGTATDEERGAAWDAASWAAAAAWATGTPAESAAAAAAAWVAAAGPEPLRAAEAAATAAGNSDAALRAQADGLRSIYGNPFARPATAHPDVPELIASVRE